MDVETRKSDNDMPRPATHDGAYNVPTAVGINSNIKTCRVVSNHFLKEVSHVVSKLVSSLFVLPLAAIVDAGAPAIMNRAECFNAHLRYFRNELDLLLARTR